MLFANWNDVLFGCEVQESTHFFPRFVIGSFPWFFVLHGRAACESRPVFLYLQKTGDMKEDYRKLSNKELGDRIQRKMQELIELRNELSRRAGDAIPIARGYDFTKHVTD